MGSIFGYNNDEISNVILALVDINGEVGFISIILVVIIIPQVLAYLLSGISGSASAPVIVRRITEFAIWSTIKFLSIVSAFLFSGIVVGLQGGFPFGNWRFAVTFVALSTIYIALSFFILLAYCRTADLLDHLQKRNAFKVFLIVHAFFTRNRESKLNTDDRVGDSSIMAKYKRVLSFFSDAETVVKFFAEVAQYKTQMSKFFSTLPTLENLAEFRESISNSFKSLSIDQETSELFTKKVYASVALLLDDSTGKHHAEIKNFISTLTNPMTLDDLAKSLSSAFESVGIDENKLNSLARKLYEELSSAEPQQSDTLLSDWD
jgi:hypothetical protein